MKILLTGSTGFLGRHVLKQLLAQGHDVVSIERTPLHTQGPSLQIVKCGLCDLHKDSLPWAEIDTVLHLAATGIKTPQRNWTSTLEANVIGTYRLLSLLAAFAQKKPQVFVAASYYERFVGKTRFFSENPYVATKHAASSLTRIWAESYPSAVVIGNFFQLYGPGDYDEHVLSYAAAAISQGHNASFGSGTSLRDWLYIDDAAEAVLKILAPQPACLGSWDIGSGQLCSIRSMVEELCTLANYDRSKLLFDPSRDRGDTMEPSKAIALPPDWSPRTSISQGLRLLLDAQ